MNSLRFLILSDRRIKIIINLWLWSNQLSNRLINSMFMGENDGMVTKQSHAKSNIKCSSEIELSNSVWDAKLWIVLCRWCWEKGAREWPAFYIDPTPNSLLDRGKNRKINNKQNKYTSGCESEGKMPQQSECSKRNKCV